MKIPETQAAKAEFFRNQHHSGKLLILPNIWNELGAKLMEQAGYRAVATASVATALSNGYTDGENIPFMQLLKIVNKISSAVTLPLTVDIERGFSNSVLLLKKNIRLLIENGAVGVNIEDSHADHKGLNKIDEQCRKIEGIREVGIQCGVPIVINTRTDIFLQKTKDNVMGQAIERGRAFKAAGADCFYPILMNNYDEISLLVEEVGMPVNVLLSKSTPDLRRLEKIGVARVSLGPNLLNHALTTMKQVADGLIHYDTTAFFSRELLSREFLNSLV
ncbi:MAG TPA: isocitrate lyase/phosphoenolpyruvate mutase family protein [Puia sp.]